MFENGQNFLTTQYTVLNAPEAQSICIQTEKTLRSR